jgi:glycosyltransferase involved in cell wall biosynthesis
MRTKASRWWAPGVGIWQRASAAVGSGGGGEDVITGSQHSAVELSVVVPLFNEEPSLIELHARLSAVLRELGLRYEVLFVDDGSTDGGAATLDRLAADDSCIGVLHLRRNFGKAAALDAGFRAARGRIVATLDADLQDLPEELPNLVAKLDQGFDMVSGWKQGRRDPLSRRVASRLFNWVVCRLSGVRLHDFNSGFKVYRAEALADLHLYGELHRYLPVLLAGDGHRVAEIPVAHAARRHGRSKYGLERLANGFFDLLTVTLNTRYRARPLHLFGLVGVALASTGLIVLSYLTVLWFLGEGPIGNRPLLFLGLLLMMLGAQLVSTGLLGELINRQIHREETPYAVRVFTAPGSAAPELRQVTDPRPDRPATDRALP